LKHNNKNASIRGDIVLRRSNMASFGHLPVTMDQQGYPQAL
jgi:hypothetical protein